MQIEPITIAGKIGSLKELRSYLTKVSEQVGLDKKTAYKLSLAVDEIATNIVNYGYKHGETQGEIGVECHVDAGKLSVSIADTATPFDPFLDAKEPDTSIPFDERPLGGWGISLAKENVDHFIYEYKDGRNYNIFIVNISN